MSRVYYFLDNSNIYHSAQKVALLKEGLNAQYSVRLQFSALTKLALNGRPYGSGRAVVSKNDYDTQKIVWDRMAAEGLFDVEIFERGSITHKEQAVDNALQLQMYRIAYNEEIPQIAVLMTGDGAGYYDEKGFLKAFVDLYNKGWGIELISWEHSCHGDLRAFAEENGVFISLDKYYDSITYLKDDRKSTPLSLMHRKNSHPKYTYLQAFKDSNIIAEYAELKERYEKMEKTVVQLMSTFIDNRKKEEESINGSNSKLNKSKHYRKPKKMVKRKKK